MMLFSNDAIECFVFLYDVVQRRFLALSDVDIVTAIHANLKHLKMCDFRVEFFQVQELLQRNAVQ
jgi:hypothetical protein